MSVSSGQFEPIDRQRKNLNWIELSPPSELEASVRAFIGSGRWLLTNKGLCLRADDIDTGPVYYMHPPAPASGDSWVVRHRIRTRAQKAHSALFFAHESRLVIVLNAADGQGGAWLNHLARIIHWTQAPEIRSEDDPRALAIARLRALEFTGRRPGVPFTDSKQLSPAEAEATEVQVQMLQGNILPALKWYETHRLSKGQTPDILNVLVAGALGETDGVKDAFNALSTAWPSTQALEHFGYLAFKGVGALSEAVHHGTRSAQLASALGAAGLYMDLARFQQRRDDKSGAWKSLVSGLEARPKTAWVNEFAASVFEWMGMLEEAEKLYDRAVALDGDRFGPALAQARLKTWRGIYDPVRPAVEALIAKRPDEAMLHRILGIIHICEGRREEGVASLNRALALAPRDAEALLWRADAAIRDGRIEDATADIERASVRTSSPADALLRIFRDMELGKFSLKKLSRTKDTGHRLSWSEALIKNKLDTLLSTTGLKEKHNPVQAFVYEIMPHLLTQEEWSEFWVDEAASKRVLKNILRRMGGNRSDIITMRQPVPEPGKLGELTCITLPESGREAAAHTLKQIRYTDVQTVLARYEDVLKAHPESPHPHCYRGELMVWLGRYEEALADFQAGKDLGPVRWGFVGKAAVLMLLGRKKEALAEIKACRKVFEPLPGATTHVYLGELLRREGDLKGARLHLEEAIEVKPSRHAAAMNLALVDFYEGQAYAAQERYAVLWKKVPGLLWTAGFQLDIPLEERAEPEHLVAVIEESLRMMRGNRSSHLITYFPNDGRMRIAPSPDEWEDIAWESLALREEILLRG